MKTIINGTLAEYKNAIKQFGREIDSLITYTLDGETIELNSDDIFSVAPHYEGDFLKSVMKQLDINSKTNIPVGTLINYKFGVKVRNDNVLDYKDNYDYINYGNYIVYSSEKNEDTNSYTLICYDKMLYAMKDYETPTISYPISIKAYIQSICDYLGLTFKNASDTFPNGGLSISKEMYLDEDGKSLNFLFRDVLDDLAELTASTICIDENDNLELRYLDGDTSPYYKYKRFSGDLTGINPIQLPNTWAGIQIRNFRLKFTPKTQLDSPFYIFRSTNFNIYYDRGVFYIYKDGNTTTYNMSLYVNMQCYILINNNNQMYINGNYVTNVSNRVLSNNRLFGNATTEVAITEVHVGYDYYPCYDIFTRELGLINNVPMIKTNGYTTTATIPDPPTYDTIDEEYINEDGAIFGELYGPINTVTIQRTSDDYTKSISAPSDLPDDEKNEIIIVDSTKQQSDLKESAMSAILNKLYGITYTKNNFKSTGLGYLDLLDKYNVSIKGNTHPCIMLNDDFQVEGGLQEFIHAGEIEKSVDTFNTSNQNVRAEDRNTFRIDKLEEKTKTISSYSTSETEIGTWLDGKTLYRKCIPITLPNNSQTYVATYIYNANIVKISGYAASGGSVIPLMYENIIYSGGAYVYTQDGGATLYIGCNFNGSSYTGYVILEYTKN